MRSVGGGPAPSRRTSLVLRAAAAVGLAAFVFHLAHGQLGLGGRALRVFADDWVYDAVVMGGALAVIARSWLVREQRWAWLALGMGMACFGFGEIYYSLAFGDSGNAPIPSLADLFYLLYYPGVYVALVLFAKSRIERLSPSIWLDGAIAAVTTAAVIAAVAFEPIVNSAAQGDAAAVATNFAYPVGDLILLGIVIGIAALSGWRPGRAWLLLGLGLIAMAIADIGYLYESASNTYAVGGMLDSLWMAAALITGSGAWQRAPQIKTARFEGQRLLVLPSLASGSSRWPRGWCPSRCSFARATSGGTKAAIPTG